MDPWPRGLVHHHGVGDVDHARHVLCNGTGLDHLLVVGHGAFDRDIGFLVGEIGIKNLINRPRPFMVNIDYSARPSELNPDFGLNIAIPSGSSFPSGHSCSSLAAATVMLIKDKRFGIPALVPALLIVFSRLYNYVHYPSDVLCGMLLGVICAVVVVLVFKKTGLDNRLSPQKVKEG